MSFRRERYKMRIDMLHKISEFRLSENKIVFKLCISFFDVCLVKHLRVERIFVAGHCKTLKSK